MHPFWAMSLVPFQSHSRPAPQTSGFSTRQSPKSSYFPLQIWQCHPRPKRHCLVSALVLPNLILSMAVCASCSDATSKSLSKILVAFPINPSQKEDTRYTRSIPSSALPPFAYDSRTKYSFRQAFISDKQWTHQLPSRQTEPEKVFINAIWGSVKKKFPSIWWPSQWINVHLTFICL